MRIIYTDGGRAEAGFKGDAGDCVTRAIAIATETPYIEVYKALHAAGGKSPRDGVNPKVSRAYLETRGWKFVPTMAIGSGTTVHLRDGEVPDGRIIVRLSKHYAAVIDGVVHDTHDPTRDGTRAVYGYFRKITPQTP